MQRKVALDASALYKTIQNSYILITNFCCFPAPGLLLNCSTHAIEVTVPKTALRDLQGDFLSLLDPSCPVIETPTHYIFKTGLDKCGTKRRSTMDFIVYSNKIVEKKAAPGSIITRVGEDEFDIPFCCYYLNNGITSAVGIKPVVKQLYIEEEGWGHERSIKADAMIFSLLCKIVNRKVETVSRADFALSFFSDQRMSDPNFCILLHCIFEKAKIIFYKSSISFLKHLIPINGYV